MPFASDPTVTAPQEMSKIRCDQCGADAEVPFIPDGKRSVYCQTCWRAKRDSQRAESGKRLERLVKSAYIAPKPEATKT
jgi:CxxC-x17-CxxC domain-containing protein